MYSVVLMMALSGSADVPTFGHRNGCHGCQGACNGGGACHGGRGCHGGLFHRGGGCHGGGACHGGGHGCHGGRGCHGGLFHKGGRCHGGNACHGGGYACHGGGACHGGAACHGGHGCHGGLFHRGGRCHGCNGGGCHGGYACNGGGCHGAAAGCNGGHAVPAPAPGPAPAPEKKPESVKPPKAGTSTALPTPATIVVSLPADARLTVDDTVTQSTTGTRTFVSPALETGKEFHYTLKAEIVRDGKTYTAIRRVAVRAGEETKVSLDIPVETLAQR